MASTSACGKFSFAALVLCGLVCSIPTYTRAGEAGIQPPTTERRTAFLEGIEGPWEAQVSHAPIGPQPYDMAFVGTAPRRVEGEVHLGASIHYWMFYEEDEMLKLRFLSTFGDNLQPLFLSATRLTLSQHWHAFSWV
jgi:hypothetical protein